MDDLKRRLRERADAAAAEGTATATGDALHFREAADAIEALQAQMAEAREQRDRAIALAEKAQDRLIEAMDRVDEARDKALDDAAMVADGAPYKRGGIVCGCSEGLAGWTATAIRAMKGERG